MKPAPFTYFEPDSVADAAEVLAAHDDAAVLAGGQSLVPLLNLRLARPAALVDLRRIASLREITHADHGALRVGAMVTTATLAAHPAISSGLREALLFIGHPQIRNRGTVGGSIAHADPAAELPAVLLALDGSVELTGASGTRQVPAGELFDGPFTTTRRPDEIVTAVVFPTVAGRSTTVEVAPRHGDFALAGAFVAVDEERRARIGLFGVGDRPLRAAAAEQAHAAGASASEVGDAVTAHLDPADDVHAPGRYRARVAGVLVRRALESLALTEAA